jgi:hypothetical protein
MTLGVTLLLAVSILPASAPVAQTPTSVPTYQPAPLILRGYSIQGANVNLKIFPFQVRDNHFEIDFKSRGDVNCRRTIGFREIQVPRQKCQRVKCERNSRLCRDQRSDLFCIDCLP